MDAWHELNIRLQMEALISEREGMIAENQSRAYLGLQAAYVKDSFDLNGSEFIRLREDLINHG